MKLFRGLKFGCGEVLGACGLTVRLSISAYLSLSDTREAVIISSSSGCSSDLSKSCLNSSFF